MTTIEQPTLPEWERTILRYGYVGPVTDDSARDTDYLITRLRHALDRASGVGAENRIDDDYDSRVLADCIELNLLRSSIEKLVGELRPYGRSGDEMFAILEQSHPKLYWIRTSTGFLGWPSYGIDSSEAERAARQLRLLPDKDRDEHREWRGVIESWTVQVHER